MNESTPEPAHAQTQSPRTARNVKRVVLATIVAVAAGVGIAAWADGRTGGCGPGRGGPDMMWGGGPGRGGPDMMWGGPRMGERMLDGLDATEAQRTQIRQIMQAGATDMRAQFDASRALRDKQMAVLSAPTIDAAAAESIRQQMLVEHDAMSKRMMQTMIAVANVLTPEQRAKLAERMKQRAEHRREHMQRGAPASAPRS